MSNKRGSILETPEADLKALSAEIGAALEEARDAYNRAKPLNVTTVTISRRSLYLLVVAAAHTYGVGIHDASKLQ